MNICSRKFRKVAFGRKTPGLIRQMNIKNHRCNASVKHDCDDGERSEGELDSSSSDHDDDDDDDVDNEVSSKTFSQKTSQSWTNMLTDQNLSSIMTNALADNTEIIHIDDPIAQQSNNPLTYVFPPGTDVDEYFQRKKKQSKSNASVRKPNRRDLKNLGHLLNNERNVDLLRAIVETIGCQRAFQYAHEAVRLYNAGDMSIKISDDGQLRTLGGFYLKMLIKDNDDRFLNEHERSQIKKRNQEIQKRQKRKKSKKNRKKKTQDNNTMEHGD